MGRKKLPDKEFVWTPQLAYAVGLIVTDGCLSSDGRHIIMRSSDKQLLETYRKCLDIYHCKIGKTGGSGYTNNDSYRVQHGDVQLYRWLRRIGVPKNKTYDIGRLHIPDNIFPDFLRGHLDGDGSITTYLDTYNTFKNPKYIYRRLWVRFLSANKSHVSWLQEKISTNINVVGRIHTRVPKDANRTNMHILKFGKKDSIKLLEYMYYREDIPCLNRKKTIAEKFIG